MVLRQNITKRIKALLHKAETLASISDISTLRKIEGLEQHEVVALATIGENIDTIEDVAAIYQIRRDMESYGFTKLATTMAFKTLNYKGLIESGTYRDYEGESYTGYALTESGWQWILENKQQFVLKRPQKDESDIPF